MERNSWNEHLSLFAEDLLYDLMSRHPLLYLIKRKQGGSTYFTEEIGKYVMLKWHEVRFELEKILRNDFPRFAVNENSLKKYLESFIDTVKKNEANAVNQIFYLSAILLEIIGFVHRRGMTRYIHHATDFLLFMFSNVKSEQFHKDGGWKFLSETARNLKYYDEVEICRQYLSTYLCNLKVSSYDYYRKIGSASKILTNLFTEKKQPFKEFIGINPQSKKECERNLIVKSNKHESKAHEVKIQDFSSTPNSFYSSSQKLSIESSILDTKKETTEDSESQEKNLIDSRLSQVSQADEGDQIASKPIKITEKDFPAKDFKLEEFLKDENMSCGNMPPGEEMNKSFTDEVNKYTKEVTKDSAISGIRSDKSLKDKDTSSEEMNEVEEFLRNSITTHFKESFIPEELSLISSDNVKSTDEKSDCLELSTDSLKRMNISDDSKDSTEVNDSNHDARFTISNFENCQKTTEGNLGDKAPLHVEKHISSVDTDNSAKEIDIQLSKLTTLETNKSTPGKYSKTSDKCRNNKTPTPKRYEKILNKDKTPSPFVSAKGKNKIESKTPTSLKSESVKNKSKSESNIHKTPTDRGLLKIQSKSSEKSEKNRRLSLTKTPPIKSNASPRSVSASNVNIKSSVSNSESGKSSNFTTIKPKPQGKVLPSSFLKSTKSTSSTTKHELGAKDVPGISNTSKHPVNPATVNTKVALEKPLSSSTKSACVSGSKREKSSTDDAGILDPKEKDSKLYKKCREVESKPDTFSSSVKKPNHGKATECAQNEIRKCASTSSKIKDVHSSSDKAKMKPHYLITKTGRKPVSIEKPVGTSVNKLTSASGNNPARSSQDFVKEIVTKGNSDSNVKLGEIKCNKPASSSSATKGTDHSKPVKSTRKTEKEAKNSAKEKPRWQ